MDHAPSIPAAEDEAHGHDPFLAHHFESQQQQFDAGKLGVWIFLMTEVLFFGGLFCAYAVYRATYPDVFRDAAHYLDARLGALNTAVLIFSSFTIAWGVRCAQLSRTRGLVVCLAVTLACAGVFLAVKYVEYKQKWEHGLLWSGFFNPHEHEEHSGDAYGSKPEPKHKMPPVPVEKPEGGSAAAGSPATDPAAAQIAARDEALRKRHLGTFFAIYFGMTGLHGIHVIAGMGVIAWVLVRAAKGHFSSRYFGPVDYVGLYWHLVDMVWIYLFPLLYLIH